MEGLEKESMAYYNGYISKSSEAYVEGLETQITTLKAQVQRLEEQLDRVNKGWENLQKNSEEGISLSIKRKNAIYSIKKVLDDLLSQTPTPKDNPSREKMEKLTQTLLDASGTKVIETPTQPDTTPEQKD